MPDFSVLTNAQAASAVLNLNRTLQSLNQTQERINTGLKIGSARDDAATYCISLRLRSDVAGFRQVRENLSLGASTLGVASSAATEVSEQLKTIKEKVTQASNLSTGRDLIQAAIDDARSQIKAITTAATFNGINMIDGNQDNIGRTFDIISSLDRSAAGDLSLSSIQVGYQDLSLTDSSRGLGAILDLDVREGKATEEAAVNDSPVYAEINLGGIAGGENFTFNYVDNNGEAQSLTFTASSAVAAGGGATPFEFTAQGSALVNATDVVSSLTQLTQNGGPLENLGFSFSAAAGGLLRITRDVGAAGGQITGITVDENNANVTAGDVVIQQAREGVNAQVSLQFNKELAAGDEIRISVFDGTNQQAITFRVGAEGDTTFASGSALAGTSNVYGLRYDEVVETTGGAKKTTTEVAARISELLNVTAGASGEAGAALEGFFTGNLNADYAVQAVNNKVVLTDLKQSAGDANEGFTGFAITTPGGSLDFDFMLQQVDAAEQVVQQVVGALGAAESRVQSQENFVDALINSVDEGIGTLVDANLAEESALFQSLQVQQQLGLQSLSIANAQPQSILALFG